MTLGLVLLQALWFILPMGLANMMPVFGKRLLPWFSWPVDGGKQWRGRPIFGAHKTWRGLLLGVLVGWLVFVIQQSLFERSSFVRLLSLFDYHEISAWLGVLMGLGAVLGDLIKSFFKRRRNIPAGANWFPWDQLDFVIGGTLLAVPFYLPDFNHLLGVLLIGLSAIIVVNRISFKLGLRETEW